MGNKKEDKIELIENELEIQTTFNEDSFIDLNDEDEVIIENIEESEVEENGN